MSIEVWWVWFAVAAIFVISEMFTTGFFLFLFGVGAAAAGVVALLGLGAGWQWAVFVGVSGVLLAVSRSFAERFSKTQPPGIGADRFVGKTGVVLEEIDNIKNTGRVRIEKDEWRADSDAGDIVKVGEQVKVTRMDGTHLVVKIINEEE